MANGTNDIREISNALSTLKEQASNLEEILKTTVREGYNVDPSIIDDILPYTVEDIQKMNEPKCREILGKYCDHNALSTTIKSVIEEHDEVTTENDAVHYILNDIKESSLKLLSTKLEIKKIESEANKLYDEVINAYNSPESIEDRKNNLLKMKEEIESETDPDKKDELQKKFMVLNNAFTLDFFTTRLETLGEVEVANIVKTFFDKTKSAYVINRFKNTIRMMKTVSPEIYRNFFNIEQYFCGEEYYKYNNLFLFVYMRFVGYCSPYNKTDKIYTQAITSAITNLMYHRFGSAKYESEIIGLVKKVDDYFKDYSEEFEKNNLMNPNHPTNIAMTKNFENERKEKIKVALDKFHVEVEDFDNKTSDELQKILNDAIDVMVESQVNEFNKTQESTDVVNDVVDPSIPEIKTEEEFHEALNEVLDSVEDSNDTNEPETVEEEITNAPMMDIGSLQMVNTDTGETIPLNLPGIGFTVTSSEENK